MMTSRNGTLADCLLHQVKHDCIVLYQEIQIYKAESSEEEGVCNASLIQPSL